MSVILDVLHFQRLLKCAGFYTGLLDGKPGPKTRAATSAFEEECARIAGEEGAFDARSEGCITTLLPVAQRAARRFLKACKLHGFEVRVISGTRTYAEQNELYAQGRWEPGKKVTYAQGGQSNHNFGLAFDVGVFEGGKYLPESLDYVTIAKLRPEVLEWGGDWPKERKDRPHYQIGSGLSLQEVRKKFEAGALRIESRLGSPR
jgi:peptidoglycan L-alanyl-D-glutamate endopeptidase CwlK